MLVASDDEAAAIELLQTELGEGPTTDALVTSRRSHHRDLGSSEARRRWPRFASAATEHGVTAVLALPLLTRGEPIGVLGLYRRQPGDLEDGQMADAVLLAELATLALDRGDGSMTVDANRDLRRAGHAVGALRGRAQRLRDDLGAARHQRRARALAPAGTRLRQRNDGDRARTRRRHPATRRRIVDAVTDRPESPTSTREQQIVEAFVHLADTLVADYDIIDFLHYLIQRCVELIDVEEAGVMIASPSGHLQPIAASTERLRLLELFELQNHDGPCLDAYRTGEVVSAPDITTDEARWPTFAEHAAAIGFGAAHSVPMQLRDETIGAINLLRARPGALTDDDAQLARALADIATIGVLQERAISRTAHTSAALQHALTSRITIEQAKGVLAERAHVSIDEAFELLRGFARRNRLGLTVVAEQVVRGGLDLV